MYRIRDLKNGLYQIKSVRSGVDILGELRKILAVALMRGLNEDDLVTAIIDMHDLNHDCAEFGVFGRLIFTYKDKKLVA